MEQSLVVFGFRRTFITLIAVVCTFLSVMNISVANVAFNDIRGNLGVSADTVSWVMTAYVHAIIMIIPFSSWLSRRLGRRNYFAIAVIVFTVGSFFCGDAADIQSLVIFRFLQGLGGGSMLVLSHTIITESWPVKKRPTAQAFFMLGMLAAGPLAAPFGGYVTDEFSWPFIFFANIPIAIILCVLVFTCVRNGSYDKNEDWVSTLMLTIGVSSLYFILARGQFNIALSLIALTGIALFIRKQPEVLRYTNLRTGLLLSFITTFGVTVTANMIASSSGWSYNMPSTPLWMIIPAMIVTLTVTVILIEKGEVLKYLIATGMLLFTIYGYMLYRTVPGDMSAAYLFWLLMIRSLAVALLSVSVTTLTLSKLEGKEIGEGVALYNIIQQLGAALGIALFSMYGVRQITSAKISAETLKRLSEMNADSSRMILNRAYASMKANQVEPATHSSPYLFVLCVGIVLLVCIPFVLYFVKNRGGNK